VLLAHVFAVGVCGACAAILFRCGEPVLAALAVLFMVVNAAFAICEDMQ
jgi:hypothetical protein